MTKFDQMLASGVLFVGMLLINWLAKPVRFHYIQRPKSEK